MSNKKRILDFLTKAEDCFTKQDIVNGFALIGIAKALIEQQPDIITTSGVQSDYITEARNNHAQFHRDIAAENDRQVDLDGSEIAHDAN